MPRQSTAVVLVAGAGLVPLLAVAAGWDWYLDGPVLLLLAVVGGYAAGAWLSPVAAGVGVLVATTGLVVANQAHDDAYHWLDDVVFFLVVVGGPAVAGAAATARARQVRRLERANADYDEQQRIDIAAARLEEQNRIQQEVHVRLAERIAGIAVRAEGAQLRDTGAGTDDALGSIEAEARGVLDQLRAALGSLGAAQDAGPGDVSSHVGSVPPRLTGRDWAVPAVLGVALAIETGLIDAARGPLWANVLVALLVTAPLAIRRRYPIAAVGLVCLAGTAMSAWLTPIPETVTGVALMVVLFYTVGAWCRGWTWVAGWAVAAAGTLAMEVVSASTGDGSEEGDSSWIVLFWTVGAVLVGRITAGWQERLRRLEEVAVALEKGKGAELRLAVARERQAIASQLHDTVAHAMTIVCLQAAGTQRADGDVQATLHTIASTAAASLEELRDGLDEIETSAQPLDRTRIMAAGRRVGVDVVVTTSGPVPVGPGAVLAFRIVREGVVNAARHAPGATVEVGIQGGDRFLRVDVLDNGAVGDPMAIGSGAGLSGLAETVASVGGTMRWGQRRGGGFEVVAEIPTTAAVAAGETVEVAW